MTDLFAALMGDLADWGASLGIEAGDATPSGCVDAQGVSKPQPALASVVPLHEGLLPVSAARSPGKETLTAGGFRPVLAPVPGVCAYRHRAPSAIGPGIWIVHGDVVPGALWWTEADIDLSQFGFRIVGGLSVVEGTDQIPPRANVVAGSTAFLAAGANWRAHLADDAEERLGLHPGFGPVWAEGDDPDLDPLYSDIEVPAYSRVPFWDSSFDPPAPTARPGLWTLRFRECGRVTSAHRITGCDSLAAAA